MNEHLERTLRELCGADTVDESVRPMAVEIADSFCEYRLQLDEPAALQLVTAMVTGLMQGARARPTGEASAGAGTLGQMITTWFIEFRSRPCVGEETAYRLVTAAFAGLIAGGAQ